MCVWHAGWRAGRAETVANRMIARHRITVSCLQWVLLITFCFTGILHLLQNQRPTRSKNNTAAALNTLLYHCMMPVIHLYTANITIFTKSVIQFELQFQTPKEICRLT